MHVLPPLQRDHPLAPTPHPQLPNQPIRAHKRGHLPASAHRQQLPVPQSPHQLTNPGRRPAQIIHRQPVPEAHDQLHIAPGVPSQLAGRPVPTGLQAEHSLATQAIGTRGDHQPEPELGLRGVQDNGQARGLPAGEDRRC